MNDKDKRISDLEKALAEARKKIDDQKMLLLTINSIIQPLSRLLIKTVGRDNAHTIN